MSEQKEKVKVSLDKETVKVVLNGLIQKYYKSCPNKDNNYYLRSAVKEILDSRSAKQYKEITKIQGLIGEPLLEPLHTLDYVIKYLTKIYKAYEEEIALEDAKEKGE